MWKVAQATVQGRRHILYDIPCQDKTYFVQKQGVCVIALADGAGSAKLSHLGAECVVEDVSNLLADRFDSFYEQSDPDIVRCELMSSILDKLRLRAESIRCTLGDLASTLLCVAVSEDDRFLIAHLGDGVIGYQDGECIKVASIPDNGEFCNTTVFTTTRGAEKSIKLFKGTLRESMKGFVLFSDGVESVLYKRNRNEISQSLLPVFDDLNQLDSSEVEQNLFETLNEIRNHTQDDCSIIVMSKSIEKVVQREDSIIENDDENESQVIDTRNGNFMAAMYILGVVLLMSVITVALAIFFKDK